MAGVRTRFAPSPTGALHVGGLRTALFSYLHARHHGGTFLLRIEDTDRSRSRPEWVDEILSSLRWVGLDWDEGPIFQSARFELYRDAVRHLLETRAAYRCTCTPDELEQRRREAADRGAFAGYDRHCRPGFGPGPIAGRPAAVRFAMPREGETAIEDVVKGRVAFRNAEVEDFVIARSDGTPTFHLVVAFDDANLRISHVVRGDDHLANSVKQIHLARALGAEPPRFAHLPQVLGPDGRRLSKRHGATAVSEYRRLGYYPEALLSFVARLGWSRGDQEIFSRDELIHLFSLEDVGASAGVFNVEKLEWLNFQILKARSPEDLARDLRAFNQERGVELPGDDRWLARVAASLRERSRTLLQLTEQADFFFGDPRLDERAATRHLRPEAAPALAALIRHLERVDDWEEGPIERAFAAAVEETGLKLGRIAQPARVAVTGRTASPGIFEVLAILGRERSLGRLRAGLERARSAGPRNGPNASADPRPVD